MAKSKTPLPNWVKNLRVLMEQEGFNPRSLSLKSGLNATAVRDMMEGRTKFPRYDTALSLATTLGTTPAILMADKSLSGEMAEKGGRFGENVELLTEIITRLQETAQERKRQLAPREFAAMAATLFRQLRESNKAKISQQQIVDLLDYDMLRKKNRR